MTRSRMLFHQRELEALIVAGNELAMALMRAQPLHKCSDVLGQWTDAKRDFSDPYGAHLRRATKETKR